MRRLLLLMALCMALALAFAPAAMAQGVPPGGGGDALCPDEAPFVATLAGDPGEASARCFPSQEEADAYRATGSASADATATDDATASASASAPTEEVSCDGFTTISGEPSQFQAQQFFDFSATAEEQAILDPDGNGFACDDGEIEFGGDNGSASASASAAASASAESAEALPDTGGPGIASAMALPMLALLVAGGIFAARRLVRK